MDTHSDAVIFAVGCIALLLGAGMLGAARLRSHAQLIDELTTGNTVHEYLVVCTIAGEEQFSGTVEVIGERLDRAQADRFMADYIDTLKHEITKNPPDDIDVSGSITITATYED